MAMNRIALLVLATTCVILAGCGHKVTEADAVGSWKVDPVAVQGKKGADVMSKMTFTLAADHTYVMAGPIPVSVKGTWAFADKKVTVTPVSLEMANPVQPGTTQEVPIGPAIAQLRTLAQKDESIQDSLTMMSESTIFDFSDDGMKLSDNGKPALIKSS